MANRVIHFEIQADDVGRAKKFYEDTFGWEISKTMSKEDGMMDYWGLRTGPDGTPGINGGLYERPKDNKIDTYDCTIMVDNLKESVEAVRKNGGKIEIENTEIPGVGMFARARDTEGNVFGMMQSSE